MQIKLDFNHIKQTSANLSKSSKTPDEESQRVLGDLKNNKSYVETCVANLSIQNDNLKDDAKARKLYTRLIFCFVFLYLFSVMMTIWFDHRISDQVLKFLLGTTTLNIVSLLAAVVRYLFPRNC